MDLLPITIRLEAPGDAEAIASVAERDSRPAPEAPRLIGDRGGTIAAALSLQSGAIVADPFTPTADLVELLRCRARSLTARPAGRPAPTRARLAPGVRLAGAGGRP